EFRDSGAHFTVAGVTLDSVDAATRDNQFLRLHAGGIGAAANPDAIDLHAQLVIVDPLGYFYDSIDWQLSCPALTACGGGFVGFIRTESIKTMPGIWRLYVVDPAAKETLLALALPVLTSPGFNQPPLASLAVEP